MRSRLGASTSSSVRSPSRFPPSRFLKTGLLASFCGGLFFDAVAPVSFGTHALLFALTHAVVFNFRDRIPRDDTLSRVVIALFANLGLFLIFSFTQVARSPAPASMWPRLSPTSPAPKSA